eukprot:Rhum_TRINITY_DN20689_c0_g1::Rhum_TRINITY_DN20689_c0_g1_i1::g.171860::m.171860
MATVMGPTPPGTGVMKPAFFFATSKSTSPTSLPLSRRLMPMSITIAPGRIHSPFTRPGLPAATTTSSAERTALSRSRQNLCTTFTHAPARSSSRAMGRPTWFDEPTTRHSRPYGFTPVDQMSCMTPHGVQGRIVGARDTRAPRFCGWKPSTSLSGLMRSITARTLSFSSPSGSGSCTRMPSTSMLLFSSSMVASSFARFVSAGRLICSLLMPTSAHALAFWRTYTFDAGFSPTSTTVRPGLLGAKRSSATRSSICFLSLARMSAATCLPSMICPFSPSALMPFSPYLEGSYMCLYSAYGSPMASKSGEWMPVDSHGSILRTLGEGGVAVAPSGDERFSAIAVVIAMKYRYCSFY